MSFPKAANPTFAFVSLLAGLAFGVGLVMAGMANPAKVLGFLDLAGRWDPSLIFVMAGGISVAACGFWVARRRTASLLGFEMSLPSAGRVDPALIGGGAAFGIGWGLAGICPGPALVLLGAGSAKALIFFVAMLCGMAIHEVAAGSVILKGARVES